MDQHSKAGRGDEIRRQEIAGNTRRGGGAPRRRAVRIVA